ncbi:MAG: class I SAM-dependent methyltransferase [Acidobacteriia bacterium]|nr:class I SAM-dependent methyltransferase [Terriglobia bacterium]
MHVNYAFLLDFARRHAPQGQTLDYGCGSGEVVRAGLAANLDIYGCETFYEGGHGSRSGADDLLKTQRVVEMQESIIPFADQSFDCVVSNMVFEHVENIDLALSEVHRVLKPGGVFLCLFPSIEVLREGHCGVPLAHRFSRSRFGYYWLLAFRILGFGYFTAGKTRREWAANFQHWLNCYCFYRPEQIIFESFARHGLEATGIEKEYIGFRGLLLFTPWLLRRAATMVLLSSR